MEKKEVPCFKGNKNIHKKKKDEEEKLAQLDVINVAFK